MSHFVVELLGGVKGQVLGAGHETCLLTLTSIVFVDHRHDAAHVRRSFPSELFQQVVRHKFYTTSQGIIISQKIKTWRQ